MNRTEVIEIAKLAGFSYDPITAHVVAVDGYTEATVTPGIERFALEVERRTLERAAKCCEVVADCDENTTDYRNGAAWCALRIRALQESK